MAFAAEKATKGSIPTTPLADARGLSGILNDNCDAVVVTDAEAMIIWVNEAALSTFEYDMTQVIGHRFGRLQPTSPGMKEMAATWHGAPASVVRNLRYRRASGTEFTGETTISAIQPNRGPVVGYLHIIRDRANSRSLEAALDDFNRVSSDWSLTPDEKVSQILDVGCKRFDLSHGAVFLATDDASPTVYEAGPGDDAGRRSHRALVSALGRAILRAEDPVLIGDLAGDHNPGQGAAPMPGHGAFAAIRLEIEGKPKGVLSFYGSAPRDSFDSGDVHLMKIMATWIGREMGIKQTCDALRAEASTDWLTQTLTRRAFMPALEACLASQNPDRDGAALICVDLDRFKQVNDRFGHAAGDAVLRIAAGRLRDACRSSDLICRLGGEEFGLLVPDVSHAQALQIAERLRLLLASDPIRVDGVPLRITASLGVAMGSQHIGSAADWLNTADRQLYLAKARGRNRVEPQPDTNFGVFRGASNPKDLQSPDATKADQAYKMGKQALLPGPSVIRPRVGNIGSHDRV